MVSAFTGGPMSAAGLADSGYGMGESDDPDMGGDGSEGEGWE